MQYMDDSEIIEPSNLCEFEDNYQGYANKPFHYSKIQENKTGYNMLNPQSVKSKYSNKFDRIKVDGKDVFITSTPDGSVKSNMHDGQYTLVDVPFRDSGLDLNELDRIYTDDSFKQHKTGFKNYKDIEGGDILYYVDKRNEEPFYSPVFSSDFNTTSVMYKDPMGGMRPQYIRHPNKDTNKITGRKSFDYSLSWIEDSNETREDILSRQIQKLNQNRWSSRWGPDV